MSRTSPFNRRGWPFFVTATLTLLVFLLPFTAGAGPVAAPPQDELPAELAELAATWQQELVPGDPSLFRENLKDPLTRRLHAGQEVFLAYCAGCHGANADGKGEAAAFLVPRPRNFRYGLDPESPPLFKFRSTASGEPPLPADLAKLIRNGLPGSAMPKHRLVATEDIDAVTEYVLWVARSSEFNVAVRLAYEDEEPDLEDPEAVAEFYEDYIVPEAERVNERYASPRELEVGAETESGADSIARGREIYQAQGCHECHGLTGRGDGSSAPTLQDSWGFPIDPRDLSTGSFRAGSAGHDLYLRIHGGVSGTPMPSFEDLPNQDTWDLVHFIQSLSATGGEQ